MSEPEQLATTIDPPRAIRVKTSTGWADLALQGAPGVQGPQGPAGPNGSTGAQGPAGQGVPVGGATGQALVKKSASDFDTVWGAAGAALTYRGAYDPAATYHDGDYVVGPDGITYVCVIEGTHAVTPAPWAPAPTIPYGTSLPVSLVDGMEAVLVDSITNPTYQWRFRYNAGHTGDAYKWECVGGAPWFTISVGDYGNIPVAHQWTDQSPTPNPMLANLRAGVYQVEYGCMTGGGNSPANGLSYMGPAVGAVDPTYYTGQQTVQGANDVCMASSARITVATAGSDIRCRYWADAGVGQAFRFMRVTPVRVA